MIKQVVGKVLRVEENVDENNVYHYGDFDYKADIVAYCKGKNGHYYLTKGYGCYRVQRIQRCTQRNADYINIISRYDGYNAPEIVTQDVLDKFGEIVANHKPYRRKVQNKDMQRQRVYAWETRVAIDSFNFDNDSIKKRTLSKDEVVMLVKRICDRTGIKIPEIVYRKANHSCAYGHWKIQLSTTSIDTVIHEMAHIVDSAMHDWKDKFQGHGPSFVGCLIQLNHEFMGWDIRLMKTKADAMNVKYDNFVFDKIDNTKLAA